MAWTPDFVVKKGDTSPPILATLSDASTLSWTLASATATCSVKRVSDGAIVINKRACSIADAANKIVRMDWLAGDATTGCTSVVGMYYAEFEVLFGGGGIETFPNNSHLVIEVAEAVN